MVITLIAAFDRRRVLGKDGKIPWMGQLPADLARFRKLTLGKPVVMGRKTYESLPPRNRPLPERVNVVLTRNPDFQAPGCLVVGSVEEAIAQAAEKHPEMVVIGGAETFNLFLPFADWIYATQIDAEFEGDTFFPKVGLADWIVIQRQTHEPDKRNRYRYTFTVLRKRTFQNPD